MNKDNHPCRCVAADSISFAAWWLEDHLSMVPRGQATGVLGKDVRTGADYIKASFLAHLGKITSQGAEGAICPYLVLLWAIAAGFTGGEHPEQAPLELVDVLEQIGAVEGDALPQIVQKALYRLKGQLSGIFIPDWNEPVMDFHKLTKQYYLGLSHGSAPDGGE